MTTAAPSPPAARRPLVVACIGECRVAVPAAAVVEVARIAAVTPVPSEDPANLGIAVHRDQVVPLVDLGARLGVSRRAGWAGPGLCLVLRTPEGLLGCPIDAVLGFSPGSDDAAAAGLVVLDPHRL